MIKKLIKELDAVFSVYIRLRDASKDGIGFCCTCFKPHTWNKLQCGHFVSRKHYALRWEEKNCASQCVSCNIFNQGQQQKFADYIDRRYGSGTSEKLQQRSLNIFHLDRGTLQILIADYRQKVAELKQAKGL